jgi:hypothetical protein
MENGRTRSRKEGRKAGWQAGSSGREEDRSKRTNGWKEEGGEVQARITRGAERIARVS